MSEALALKYRPTKFEDLCEQAAVRTILLNQIETNTIKQAYLFTGPAGCGKTTSARIFANMINPNGQPIELDAASNNSVEDIRNINEQAQNKSLNGGYKIFILDEVHMLSNSAWNAFLKTLEEPPVGTIFIMCTTNAEKIPATILSRAQRYNFQKISTEGIYNRLIDILVQESITSVDKEAIEYIAKLANGGLRDAITLLDKCLSYTHVLTEQSVVEALGVANYNTMYNINDCFFKKDVEGVIGQLDWIYSQGIDMKLFIQQYFEFVLDIVVWGKTKEMDFIKLPKTMVDMINDTYKKDNYAFCYALLEFLTELQYTIKYESNPKAVITAKFILIMGK